MRTDNSNIISIRHGWYKIDSSLENLETWHLIMRPKISHGNQNITEKINLVSVSTISFLKSAYLALLLVDISTQNGWDNCLHFVK